MLDSTLLTDEENKYTGFCIFTLIFLSFSSRRTAVILNENMDRAKFSKNREYVGKL